MDEKTAKQAMRQAKASLAVEGFKITEQNDQLVKAVLTNQLTEEEFFKQVNEIVFSKKF